MNIPNDKALDLEVRKKIYVLIRKSAGSHFRELTRLSALSVGSLHYHLGYLVKHGLISEVKKGNSSRYYPLEVDLANKEMLGYLRQKSVRHIVLFILTHAGCNHEEIVKSVGIGASTVSWHLKKLVTAKIVEHTKKGRKSHFRVLSSDRIMRLLITYEESFLDSLVSNVIEMWDV